MDSFLPLGGFQLPFQRHLSRLYNDTKKSSDFVKEPIQNEEDPEVKSLHRKLRIQKHRLVTWGLEWSDSSQSAEIDEFFSKAGLSEVAGSIMSTIKDILAEAEPLWLSSKHLADGNRPDPDRKSSLVEWNKSRFEDLVNDLTSSIDTLYDLSRTRSNEFNSRQLTASVSKAVPSMSGDQQYQSTRIETPQIIDPSLLNHVGSCHSGGAMGSDIRETVLISKNASPELTNKITDPWAPLLLEYATFDSIYSMTGIMPPMDKFEKLSAGLQNTPPFSSQAWSGLPRLVGYFEEKDKSRLGLLYRFPTSSNPTLSNRPTPSPFCDFPTLQKVLSQPKLEPGLEDKFRLAFNLASTVFDMHARGITHGNLVPSNVSFSSQRLGPGPEEGTADIRYPVISFFDIFPQESLDTSDATPPSLESSQAINRRSFAPTGIADRAKELNGLFSLLLSIGLWSSLASMSSVSKEGGVAEDLLEKLSLKCGKMYMEATRACALSSDSSDLLVDEYFMDSARVKVLHYLEACCAIDDLAGVQTRIAQNLMKTKTARPSVSEESQSFVLKQDVGPSKETFHSKAPFPDLEQSRRGSNLEASWDRVEGSGVIETPKKVKLYPNVALPSDAVEKWNTILMPQMNQALKQFYRKHPESVEISLESVGTDPENTQPTVLVVCTSVKKVRAILRKRLGDLVDGPTGLSLKVCSGSILRSHKQYYSECSGDPRILQFSEDEHIEPMNPTFQERPLNGASIGAWIGDRHLPPVTFGGLVTVNGQVYGMTVHHMLDDENDQGQSSGKNETSRSSSHRERDRDWLTLPASGSADDHSSYEISDTESESYSESDIGSDCSDEEDDDEPEFEPGDIPGIEPGCGEGYIITQPALDDVEEDFYPCEETVNEDHLDTFSIGELYASSGIKRMFAHGLVHEIDWALFTFSSDRLPMVNAIPRSICNSTPSTEKDYSHDNETSLLYPREVANFASLSGMEVQCMGRSSGLQTGQILPALTSIKIYGRSSPSHAYQVTSSTTSSAFTMETSSHRVPKATALGIPGDSGAWIVHRQTGQLCGHVLAWSSRKRVAYICPMDVLLMDMAQTLDGAAIKLPAACRNNVVGENQTVLETEMSHPGIFNLYPGHQVTDGYEVSSGQTKGTRNLDLASSVSALYV